MPWKQWAYLEKVSSADFQTFLQNQTVPVFTTTAQRDTIYTPAPPPKGALCVTADTLTTWLWDGTQWVPREPERVVYENTTTAALGASFTAEAVLLTTTPVQITAGRRYYWRFSARGGNNAAGGGTVSIRLRLTNLAGTALQLGEVYFAAAINLALNFEGPLVGVPTGPQTFALTGQSSSGAGTVQGFATAPNMLQILERT